MFTLTKIFKIFVTTYKYFIYTDEDLKWDKPLMEGCLLIHLSVTLPLNLY